MKKFRLFWSIVRRCHAEKITFGFLISFFIVSLIIMYSTSTPASSAGYRASSSAPYSASAPASSAGYGSGPSAGVVSGPAPSASAPAGDGGPPSTPSSDSSKSSDGGKRRRGPGWGGVLTTAVVVALLASGGTVAGLHYFDYFGEKAQPAASAVPTSVATGATTQIVTSMPLRSAAPVRRA